MAYGVFIQCNVARPNEHGTCSMPPFFSKRNRSGSGFSRQGFLLLLPAGFFYLGHLSKLQFIEVYHNVDVNPVRIYKGTEEN